MNLSELSMCTFLTISASHSEFDFCEAVATSSDSECTVTCNINEITYDVCDFTGDESRVTLIAAQNKVRSMDLLIPVLGLQKGCGVSYTRIGCMNEELSTMTSQGL